jgi:uncharacterized protein (DUF433 family)
MRDAPLVAILARGNLFSVTWDGEAAQWLFPKHFVARRIIGPVFQDTKVQFTRIMIDPRRMGGVPCIRELRIPVATVLDMVAEGMDAQEILKAYPDLEAEDIPEALRFCR